MTANHEVDAYNLGKVKADIDADMWVLGARMSMPFGQNRVWMTPYLGVDVMKLTQDGFTSSWSGMDAFRYSDVDATIVRTPVGVRAGTFMPLELFGRSGTVNWDADISFIPQFGDKDADFKVSGISNGHYRRHERRVRERLAEPGQVRHELSGCSRCLWSLLRRREG